MAEAPSPDPSYHARDHDDLAWFAEASARDKLTDVLAEIPAIYADTDDIGIAEMKISEARAWALISIAESLRRIESSLDQLNNRNAAINRGKY